jgi:hypothetical protein
MNATVAVIHVAIQEDLPNALALVTRSVQAFPWVSRTGGVTVPIPRIQGWFTGPIQFMRSFSFSVVMHSVEFRRELRLKAAAGLFELSFGARQVSQQCMKLPWAQ